MTQIHLVVFQVGKLDIVYSLKQNPDVTAKLPEKCKLKDNSEFYIQKDHVDHKDLKTSALAEVNKELAKFFSHGSLDCFNDLRYVGAFGLQSCCDAFRKLVSFRCTWT